MTVLSAHVPLARLYRPQRFAEVKGQDAAVSFLSRIVETGKVPYGFLFTGIRGVGKTTLARLMARALNCMQRSEGTAEPCGQCASCQALSHGNHVDVIEIDAASHTGVDDVRVMIESSRYVPVMGRYKIFIVDEVHMLSKSAFNALLKTLEEPPAHAVFMLATTELSKVPDTIWSRCAKVFLRSLSGEEVQKCLQEVCEKENISIEESALSLLARSSEGSVRDGLSLLESVIVAMAGAKEEINEADVVQILGLADPKEMDRLTHALQEGDSKTLLECAKEFYGRGVDPKSLVEQLLLWCHQCICAGLAQEKDRKEEKLSLMQWHYLWQVLLKGWEELGRSPFPQQTLEVLLMRIVTLLHIPSPEAFNPFQGGAGGNPVLSQEAQGVEPDDGYSTLHQSLGTLSGVVQWLHYHKHPLLAEQLRRNVVVVQWSLGRGVISLRPACPSSFPRELESTLVSHTHFPWRIEVVQGAQGMTIEEQDDVRREDLKAQAMTLPLVERLLAMFPGAQIVEVAEEEDVASPEGVTLH